MSSPDWRCHNMEKIVIRKLEKIETVVLNGSGG